MPGWEVEWSDDVVERAIAVQTSPLRRNQIWIGTRGLQPTRGVSVTWRSLATGVVADKETPIEYFDVDIREVYRSRRSGSE